MTQRQLAKFIGCSVETVRKIEKGRIPLSEELAHKTSVATGVSRAWLLVNKLHRPPVNVAGRPYTRDDFDKAQMDGKTIKHPVIIQYFSIALYARIRAIMAAAEKRQWSDARMAHHSLDNLLTELEKKYGWDTDVYPALLAARPNFLSALKLARADVETFEAELHKSSDDPDRLISPGWLTDDPVSIKAHEHVKTLKGKKEKL